MYSLEYDKVKLCETCEVTWNVINHVVELQTWLPDLSTQAVNIAHGASNLIGISISEFTEADPMSGWYTHNYMRALTRAHTRISTNIHL